MENGAVNSHPWPLIIHYLTLLAGGFGIPLIIYGAGALLISAEKNKQILNAFQDNMDPKVSKYVCAPCSNCKGAIRDMLEHYRATERCGIHYGGLVELIVNAMVDVEKPMLEALRPLQTNPGEKV